MIDHYFQSPGVGILWNLAMRSGSRGMAVLSGYISMATDEELETLVARVPFRQSSCPPDPNWRFRLGCSGMRAREPLIPASQIKAHLPDQSPLFFPSVTGSTPALTGEHMSMGGWKLLLSVAFNAPFQKSCLASMALCFNVRENFSGPVLQHGHCQI